MLSLPKLLLLVAVAVGVFYAYRVLRRPRPPKPVRKAETKALDMRKCPVCGVYVGEGEGACGKPNCPAG